jgi:hypothetical protein
VKAGYLTKSPPEGRLGQWQKRWFVFADSHRAYPLAPRYVRMEYYHSAEDAEMCRNPKGGSRRLVFVRSWRLLWVLLLVAAYIIHCG